MKFKTKNAANRMPVECIPEVCYVRSNSALTCGALTQCTWIYVNASVTHFGEKVFFVDLFWPD